MYSLLSRIGIEVWKDIPEFDGIYQVSNLGNIRSTNFKKQGITKQLKKNINTAGRKYVCLSNKGKTFSNQNIYVLVARAFLGHKPCGYKLVVDHIDNNPLNDNLYNLQTISHRKNISKSMKGTSKYTGVCWNKARKKWKASISINKKIKNIGHYKTELKAANAYKKALKEYERSK